MANDDEMKRAFYGALQNLMGERAGRGNPGGTKAEGIRKKLAAVAAPDAKPDENDEAAKKAVREVLSYRYFDDAEQSTLKRVLESFATFVPWLHEETEKLLKKDEDADEKKHAMTLEDFDAYCAEQGIELRYNVLSRHYDTGGIDAEDLVTDAYSNLVNVYTRVTPDICHSYAKRLSRMHSYNPVMERLSAVRWDGVDRVTTLCDAMRIDADDSLSRVLVRKWLCQAVALAQNEKDFGIAAQGVLVLQGPEGIGKSTLVQRLVFGDLDLWTDETLHVNDKDSKMHVTSKWIAEMPELGQVFRRNDADAIKRFLTAPRDSFRVPYAKDEETHPRRVSFFGTLNPKGGDYRYLSGDDTNRRFWTVIGHYPKGTKLDHKAINEMDMVQLWRQSFEDVRENGPSAYELTKAEQDALITRNKNYSKPLPAEEELRDIIAKADLTDIYGKAFYKLGLATATDIIKDNDSLKRFSIQQIGAALNKLGFEQDRRRRYNFWRPVYSETSVFGQAEKRAAKADEE